MQFITKIILSLALVLSASAAPLFANDATVDAQGEVNVLQKCDRLSCNRRGPGMTRSVVAL
jgi:hypothetical protein